MIAGGITSPKGELILMLHQEHTISLNSFRLNP
jgi:hypothetical protein